jgi:hypothetical protein
MGLFDFGVHWDEGQAVCLVDRRLLPVLWIYVQKVNAVGDQKRRGKVQQHSRRGKISHLSYLSSVERRITTRVYTPNPATSDHEIFLVVYTVGLLSF